MSHYFEFTGSNLQEAIDKAMIELQVARSEFRYKIIADEDNDDHSEVLIRVYLGGQNYKSEGSSQDSRSYHKKAPYKNKRDTYTNPHLEEVEYVFTSIDEIDSQNLLVQKILLFIKELLHKMEITLQGYILEDREEEYYLNLQCTEPAVVIGKQGASLNALQFLVGAYVPTVVKDSSELEGLRKNFTLDIQGYRNKRLNILKHEIDNTAKQVRQTNKGILLPGEYAPIERRQIHLYAKSLPGITTESQGTNFLKAVLIKLID